MPLEQRINEDIKAAMIAKDTTRLRGLRAIKAAILLANTEKGQSESVSPDTEVKVLQKLVKQRKESAEIYKNQNREDLYQIEIEEQTIIEEYLPKQLERTEVEGIIKEIITATNATSIKDMGKVMSAANQKLAGQADGRTISELVKALLS